MSKILLSSLIFFPFILFTLTLNGHSEEKDKLINHIKRFDEVDKNLYRGGQPDDKGFKLLKELGIKKSDISIFGVLDDYASSTGYLISPFVGKIPYPYDFKINKSEVSEIIIAPLEEFKKIPKTGYVIKNAKSYPVYYYELPDHVIWGATARIVKNFIEVLFK